FTFANPVLAYSYRDGDLSYQALGCGNAVPYVLPDAQPPSAISTGQEDSELVSTEPKHVILRSDKRTENLRNRLKHFVSGFVTMSVVHSHHPINFEHEYRQRP